MELAFLTAIQWLPGRQRAVLILRDVLGWSAAEVAGLLDTSPAAANSALQRARATIEGELGVRPVAPARAGERELLRRYVDAWEQADIAALVALLRDDAVITMPPQPAIHGAAAIGAFMERVSARHDLVATPSAANRQPAVALYERTGDGGLRAAPVAAPRRRGRPDRAAARVRSRDDQSRLTTSFSLSPALSTAVLDLALPAVDAALVLEALVVGQVAGRFLRAALEVVGGSVAHDGLLSLV